MTNLPCKSLAKFSIKSSALGPDKVSSLIPYLSKNEVISASEKPDLIKNNEYLFLLNIIKNISPEKLQSH